MPLSEVVVRVAVRVRNGGFHPVDFANMVVRIVAVLDFANKLRSRHFGAGKIVVEALVLTAVRFIDDLDSLGHGFSMSLLFDELRKWQEIGIVLTHLHPRRRSFNGEAEHKGQVV